MSHLSLETLARLADEPPGPDEAAHLAGCATCAFELEAMRDQRLELAALPPVPPPATGWSRLERRLRREGLFRAPPTHVGLRFPGLLRLAAALAIFLSGAVTGAALRGAAPATNAARLAGGTDAGAFQGPADDASTAQRAERALRDAEAAYLTALSRYADFAGPSEPANPVARLAALESIVLTTRVALNQAPADPVINGYHLSALAEREATLRQVSATAGEPWF